MRNSLESLQAHKLDGAEAFVDFALVVGMRAEICARTRSQCVTVCHRGQTSPPGMDWARNASAGTLKGWQRFPSFATAKGRNLP